MYLNLPLRMLTRCCQYLRSGRFIRYVSKRIPDYFLCEGAHFMYSHFNLYIFGFILSDPNYYFCIQVVQRNIRFSWMSSIMFQLLFRSLIESQSFTLSVLVFLCKEMLWCKLGYAINTSMSWRFHTKIVFFLDQ